MSRNFLRVFIVSVLAFQYSACGVSPEKGGESKPSSLRDVKAIVQRGDGLYEITCLNDTQEILSADQIRREDVCNSAKIPSEPPRPDIFSGNVCQGANLYKEDLKSKIGLPISVSRVLGRFSSHMRMRTCYQGVGCTDWSYNGELPNVDSKISTKLFNAYIDGAYIKDNSAGNLLLSYTSNSLNVEFKADGEVSGINTYDIVFNAVTDRYICLSVAETYAPHFCCLPGNGMLCANELIAE